MARSDDTASVREATEARTEPRLAVSLARSPADIEDAQRLRYKVFAEEMGARIGDAGSAAVLRHHGPRLGLGGQKAACRASTTVSTSGRVMR